MKIRHPSSDRILDVYFLVQVHELDSCNKTTLKVHRITKEPTIEGIRKQIPGFPEFVLHPKTFTFEKVERYNHGSVYLFDIRPIESCDDVQ